MQSVSLSQSHMRVADNVKRSRNGVIGKRIKQFSAPDITKKLCKVFRRLSWLFPHNTTHGSTFSGTTAMQTCNIGELGDFTAGVMFQISKELIIIVLN